MLGRHIFQKPKCPDYHLAYGDGNDTLWRSFSVIILTINHRQGKDQTFADMLNRIRVGKQTKEDIDRLKARVKPENHHEITSNSTKICSTREEAAEFNRRRLNNIPGKLYTIEAKHVCRTKKNYQPMIKKAGKIADTQFENTLQIKVGGRVMLIYNIAVYDGLCNGAMGTVLAIEGDDAKCVRKVIVQFDNKETGGEMRKKFPIQTKKYPQGTVITRMELEYSLGKIQSGGASAKLHQFPLISSFAVTAWKFQGKTVKNPGAYSVDLRKVRKAAQSYVMLSRGECEDQLSIVEKLPEDKLYPDKEAIRELERMEKVSINANPTAWDTVDNPQTIKVSFLNARSVKNKFDSIKTDTSIQKSNLIFLAETWLEINDNVPVLSNYATNLCGGGRGQGMVAFSTESFTFDDSKDKEKMNLIKMKHKSIDIIGVYISQKADHSNVIKNLISMVDITRPTLIIGDFNICLRKNKNNPVTNFLISAGFSQLVKETTHIEVIDILVLKVSINLIHSQGGLIDHVYIFNINEHHINLQLVPKYFSDHDALYLTIISM